MLQRLALTTQPSSAALERHLVGSEPEVLNEIGDGRLSLIVWQRKLPLGLGHALRRWAALEPPRFWSSMSEQTSAGSNEPGQVSLLAPLVRFCSQTRRN